ncbi:MAG: ATP-binding protein [Oligoflexia bacterium]|nr:ATP-binding protein [Oligoflexia bacterium]
MPAYTAKIDLLFESTLLLAAVCFAMSVYVLAKGIGNKLNLSYSALTFCVSLWSFSFFVANVLEWRLLESVHILSTLLLAPLALLFLSVLLRPEGWVFRVFLWTTLVTSLALVPLVIFGLDRFPLIRALSFYSPSLIVLANLYLFLSEVLGAVKPRGGWEFEFDATEIRQRLRRRNFWLYLGGVCVTMLSVLDRVPWMGRTLPAIGNLLLALYFFFIKDAVINQTFVSSRKILGRLLAQLTAALVFFFLFILMNAWVKQNLVLYLINTFFAAYVGVVIMDPLRSLASIAFQRFFFREATRIEKMIHESGKEIAGASHVSAIAIATEKFIHSALNAEMVSLYVLDADGSAYQKVFQSKKMSDLPKSLHLNFPLIAYWKKNKKWIPALGDEISRASERETLPDRVAFLRLTYSSLENLGSTLAFPFTHERQVLGFATVHLADPPDHWEESWGALLLLAPYFERAGEALRELDVYARLRDKDRLAALGEMAAGLAHEIRNPLGAIKGAAQVMETKESDPNAPFLKIIIEEVNRLNFVVSQFLNYAKPFQGKSELSDLSKAIHPLIERYREIMKSKGIEFDLSIDNALPHVWCQAELIGLVFTNLVDNAVRAVLTEGNEKKPKISITLSHTIHPNEFVLIVADNGIGMTAEVVEKIFIPFFTKSLQGTGLGLSICQKIAEAHGGSMEVKSSFKKGTEMKLRIPLKLGEA